MNTKLCPSFVMVDSKSLFVSHVFVLDSANPTIHCPWGNNSGNNVDIFQNFKKLQILFSSCLSNLSV